MPGDWKRGPKKDWVASKQIHRRDPNAFATLLLEFDHHHFEQLITEILFRVPGRSSPGDIARSGLQDF